MAKLRALQSAVIELANNRNKVLDIFLASRFAATALAQRELWLEFSWADQEYRSAVRDLARFCLTVRRLGPDEVASPANHG